jgi:hypothetical protein
MNFVIYEVYRSPNCNIDITLQKVNNVILHCPNLKITDYKIILEKLNIDIHKPSNKKILSYDTNYLSGVF